MGILPIGSPAAVFPTKRPEYPERVAGRPGRDIRTHSEGDQEAEPSICTSVVAMPGSGCSPTPSRGTRRSPDFRLQSGRDPEAKSGVAVGGSRRGSDVGLLKFGRHCQGRRFTDCSVFTFLRQGILDGEPASGAHQRRLTVSHSTRRGAYDSCTSMPWRPPPIGRSR